MRVLTIYFMLFLASCSSHHKTPTLDAKPFVREFEKDFRYTTEVPVKFDALEPQLAGVCIFHPDGMREIFLNSNSWSELTDDQRQMLVYHELIHCEFRLDHIGFEQFPSGCPKGLMRPNIFSKYQATDCFKRHREYYISEVNMTRLVK